MSKADDLFFKEFGAVAVVLTVFVIAMYFLANNIGGNAFRMIQNAPSSVAARLAPVGSARLDGEPVSQPVSVAAAPAASGLSGEEVYNGGGCSVCHGQGVAGAPKLGDADTWKTRFEQGLDALVSNAVNGKGVMPAKGGNAALSDDEVERAIVFMLKAADIDAGGAGDAPPAAPAAETVAEQPAAEQAAASAQPAVEATETAAAEQPATETAAAVVDTKRGQEVYQMACMACHATGAAGAPKTDDAAAWAERAAGGEDALVNSAIKGKGVMPAKGGNMSLTDDDIRNAVRFILDQAGVSG